MPICSTNWSQNLGRVTLHWKDFRDTYNKTTNHYYKDEKYELTLDSPLKIRHREFPVKGGIGKCGTKILPQPHQNCYQTTEQP